MESRASFPTVESRYLRGETVGTDTGYIPPASGYKNPGPTDNLRGIERNTARGVTEPVVLKDIVELSYAPATDAPEVTPYKTYGAL